MQDVFNTLQVYMGGYYVNLFNKFGRTWQVNLLADQKFRTDERYLKQLKVRNKQGKMVPLGTVADGAADHRPGDGDALQHVHLGAGQRQHGAGGQLRRRASQVIDAAWRKEPA